MSSEYVKLLNALPRPDLYDSWELVKRHMPIEQPPSAASYIVFQKGGQCYAKNGTTGHIEFGPGGASTVIQSAINALANGGKIFIKAGTYIINSPLVPVNKLHLIGENIEATKLQLGSGVNDSMIKYTGTETIGFFTIEHMTLYGSRSVNTAGNGIEFAPTGAGKVWDFVARDIFISDFKGKGFVTNDAHHYVLDHVIIEYCENIALHIAGGDVGSPPYIINCLIKNNLYTSGYAISIVNPNAHFFSNQVLYNYGYGLLLGAADIKVICNTFIGNSAESAGARDEIWVPNWAPRQVILGNKIDGNNKSRYGVNLESNDNIVQNNPFANLVTAPIRNVGTGNVTKYNPGYVTENGGTATFSGNGSQTTFTIAHGLAGTPKTALITAGSSDAKTNFYVTYDATNITVTFATAPPSGTNNVVLRWYAEM